MTGSWFTRNWRLALAGLLLTLGSQAALAASPNNKKVETDVTAYWKKNFPDQPIADVVRKTNCEKGEIDGPKGKKIPTCLIKADVYVAKGYRLFIYRDTFLHYLGAKLTQVLLGELQKSWKEGGVPAPTPDQAINLLRPLVVEKLGAVDPQLTIEEVGAPRLHGELFRVSVMVDLAFKKDGAEQKRNKVLVTFQSDGGDWAVVPELSF
jgi:hypothetical protein